MVQPNIYSCYIHLSKYTHPYNRERELKANAAKCMGHQCNISKKVLKFYGMKAEWRSNAKNKIFFLTLKSLISEYFVCLVPGAIYKYNFLQCCHFALAVIQILFFNFLAFSRWLVRVIIFASNIILNPFLQMKRNIFYWDRLRSRENKCNLKQRNLS